MLPITPASAAGQIITNPAQALAALQNLSVPAQQQSEALSMVVSNQMMGQYRAAHAPPPPAPTAQTQWPVSQPPQEPVAPRTVGLPPPQPPFRMMPVVSSTLQLVGYDPRAQQMHIQFKSGADTYVHDEVPMQMFAGLMNAKSKGSFYANQIKGKFKYSKQKPIPPQL